jgi:hypothetical protein
MKTWSIVLVSLLGAVCLGLGLTWADFRASEPLAALRPVESAQAQPQAAVPEKHAAVRLSDGPVAQVDNPTFNFGYMELGTHMEHDFVITNVGRAPLELTKGDTSCKCTISKMLSKEDKVIVPPGGSETINLAWDAKVLEHEFRQHANIHTNDPRNNPIRLVVEGQVTRSTVLTPATLVFTEVSPSYGATADAWLYSFRKAPFEITSHEFSDPATAEFFEVAISQVPSDKLDYKGARHGYRIQVKVKPGVPLGRIDQILSLKTTHEALETAVLPITGKVASNFSVAGRGWDANKGALRLGMVNSAEGAARTLNLMVRGPDHEQTTFEIESIEPEQLRVELGESKTVSSGSVTLAPLTITVPVGAPPMNHMGSAVGAAGHVMLKTNRPDMPHVRIDVLFAVSN